MDPSEVVANEQEKNDANRNRYANRQRGRGAFLFPFVVHQEVQGEAQCRDNSKQPEDEHDFDEHGLMRLLRNWRPRPIVVIVALAGIAVCTRLSLWQLDRGQEKAEIERSRLEAGMTTATAISDLPTSALPLGHRLRLVGEWEPEKVILLDNQTRQGQPGVHVWTLFRLASGQGVMVDRGWTALSADRALPFTPASIVSAEPQGVLRDLPRAGIQTENNCDQNALPRLNYPTLEDLRCALGEPVEPALLLLDADLPGAYIREWQYFEIPPARHYGYAFQWAALALTILFLFLRFNRVPPKDVSS